MRLAGVGSSGDSARPRVDDQTRFEIGSVTKGPTGLLLAEQVARGEAAPDEPLGEGARPWRTWRPTPPACPGSRCRRR